MAAKTFDSWLSDSGHASWPSSMCQAMNKAWNAATKAAEARFTSNNTGSPKLFTSAQVVDALEGCRDLECALELFRGWE